MLQPMSQGQTMNSSTDTGVLIAWSCKEARTRIRARGRRAWVAAKPFAMSASRTAGCGSRADALTVEIDSRDEDLSAFMCVQTTTAIDETNDKATMHAMATVQDQPPIKPTVQDNANSPGLTVQDAVQDQTTSPG